MHGAVFCYINACQIQIHVSSCAQKSRIKTKKLANRKTKRKKKIQMLLDSNPHLLRAKTLDYPPGYRGIVMNFIQISNSTTI